MAKAQKEILILHRQDVEPISICSPQPQLGGGKERGLKSGSLVFCAYSMARTASTMGMPRQKQTAATGSYPASGRYDHCRRMPLPERGDTMDMPLALEKEPAVNR